MSNDQATADTGSVEVDYWTRESAAAGVSNLIPPGEDGNCNDWPDLLDPWGPVCVRKVGHPGRHIAEDIYHHVVAAWPGTHIPTVEDLTTVKP